LFYILAGIPQLVQWLGWELDGWGMRVWFPAGVETSIPALEHAQPPVGWVLHTCTDMRWLFTSILCGDNVVVARHLHTPHGDNVVVAQNLHTSRVDYVVVAQNLHTPHVDYVVVARNLHTPRGDNVIVAQYLHTPRGD
jgi:hypothetical protein